MFTVSNEDPVSMIAAPTYNFFPEQNEVVDGLNWREDEMNEVLGELTAHREAFDRKLVEDVTPADLAIGGGAVAHIVNRLGWTYYIGPRPEAEVSLSYVASDGELQVRLSKTRNDGATYDNAALLANQVTKRGLWVPFADIERRRIAKITKLVAGAATTEVEIFDLQADANGGTEEPQAKPTKRIWLGRPIAPINTDEVLDKASWMAHAAYGYRYVQEHMDEYPPAAEHDGTDPLANWDRAWAMTVDSMREQANAKPTAEEYATEAQRAIDGWFTELHEKHVVASMARRVVENGRRIRQTSAETTA